MSLSGVFCSTTLETATADKDVATFKQMRVKAQQAEALKLIFKEIDHRDMDEVTFEELQDAMSSGDLSNFMEAMGISTNDVWMLCVLLDVDKNGVIDLDEFVNGCVQLHGPAKSLQMAKMGYENKLTRQALLYLITEFESLASKLLLVDEENDKDEAEDEEDEEEPLKEKF